MIPVLSILFIHALSRYPNYSYQPKAKKGADGERVLVVTKKRQMGSKAGLKAQEAQAKREEKAKAKAIKAGTFKSKECGSDEEEEEESESGQDYKEPIGYVLLPL